MRMNITMKLNINMDTDMATDMDIDIGIYCYSIKPTLKSASRAISSLCPCITPNVLSSIPKLY
jgi:hypothetical protein